MPQLINFEDAVTAANLDPNQAYAVYYEDGAYANRDAVAARCPHAKLFAITVHGATGPGIFCLDSENGDMDTGARDVFPQTEAWVAEQVRLNVSPIVVYANEDRWLNLGLLGRLAHYGNRIERWDANFDGNATLPSWADAKQYLSGGVDRNVALAGFFGNATPAPPADPHHYDWFYTGPFPSKLWGNLNERLVVEQYDGARKHPVKYAAYLLLLRAKLRFLANRVAKEAGAGQPNPTWGQFHRGWRFQELIHRAQGQQLVK